MKLKKFLVSLTTLAFLLMLGGSNIVNAQFNTQEQAVEPQVSVKRIWLSIVKYYAYGEEPPYIFYEHEGFKGYLGKKISFSYKKGTGTIYEGYLYAGNQYPIPASKNNQLSSLKKKNVMVHINYVGDITRLPDYWYNDGVYRGWLYERDAEAYQNKNGSWEVYYYGTVVKGPFVPNSLINKDKR